MNLKNGTKIQYKPCMLSSVRASSEYRGTHRTTHAGQYPLLMRIEKPAITFWKHLKMSDPNSYNFSTKESRICPYCTHGEEERERERDTYLPILYPWRRERDTYLPILYPWREREIRIYPYCTHGERERDTYLPILYPWRRERDTYLPILYPWRERERERDVSTHTVPMEKRERERERRRIYPYCTMEKRERERERDVLPILYPWRRERESTKLLEIIRCIEGEDFRWLVVKYSPLVVKLNITI